VNQRTRGGSDPTSTQIHIPNSHDSTPERLHFRSNDPFPVLVSVRGRETRSYESVVLFPGFGVVEGDFCLGGWFGDAHWERHVV
jgi:hypothetical protein